MDFLRAAYSLTQNFGSESTLRTLFFCPADGVHLTDLVRHIREMVQIWAERAVKAAKLVEYPRDDTDPIVREAFNRNVEKTAKQLTSRVIMPGEWFLVRWGGTRKGAGTFYTRPQLAVPTTRRTLQPLAYDMVGEDEWRARNPEEILMLKVCDPAVGSGSFLIAALRYLTDALLESLHTHGRLNSSPNKTIARLADGQPLDHASQESVPVPADHPEFEERLRARLKRHVVERCLYGVDKDPLAVELARLAMWIETMDPRLPFSFVDHKIRCGDALVGCWFDRFQDYPVMAWGREGGDKDFTRFVHHVREYVQTKGKKKGEIIRVGDVWTQRIKEIRDDVIKPEMRDWILAQQQRTFAFHWRGQSAESIHDQALQAFKELHDLPVHETEIRAELFDKKIRSNPAFAALKEAFDCWCAIWFWPGDDLDHAPSPRNFTELSASTAEGVRRISEEHRFFHWELEFPDVFSGRHSGFDAVIGNPPWEIQKPNSKEFFSNVDPLYRTYGKIEALDRQKQYFLNDSEVERGWLQYCAFFKCYTAWNKYASAPFGDDSKDNFSFTRSTPENRRLHELWGEARQPRSGYADPAHPFQYQGSADINTYKMFCEASHGLLRRGGRLGMILPSGIYTDKGSTHLRSLFLSQSKWEWLFVFINWKKIFTDIYYRFKFAIVIVEKAASSSSTNTCFGRYNIEDWEEPEEFALPYPARQVEKFSPRSKAFLEIRTSRDLEILEKLYRNSVLLGDDSEEGWHIQYAREFDMTNDSKLFPPLPAWEGKGYQPNEYGHWSAPDGDVALPLYEGRMIGQFDFSQKGWVSGKSRRAVWREIPWDAKVVQPQFCMQREVYLSYKNQSSIGNATSLKLCYMDVTSSTNARTMVAALLPDVPCGNKVPTLTPIGGGWTSDVRKIFLSSVLNSFVFDYQVRSRLGGMSLNAFIVEELALPLVKLQEVASSSRLLQLTISLALPNPVFAHQWLELYGKSSVVPWKRLWAITLSERMRLRCMVDALIAELYELSIDDYEWIVRECDYPRDSAGERNGSVALDPKGFWRVDQEKDPELRHTILSLVAFRDLKRLGLDAFLTINEGDGWMLPESLRLADLGLGRDSRAQEHQPVASRFGARFLPWQLGQSVQESWQECASHAEKMKKLSHVTDVASASVVGAEAPGARDLFGTPLDTDLFGNPKPMKRRGKT